MVDKSVFHSHGFMKMLLVLHSWPLTGLPLQSFLYFLFVLYQTPIRLSLSTWSPFYVSFYVFITAGKGTHSFGQRVKIQEYSYDPLDSVLRTIWYCKSQLQLKKSPHEPKMQLENSTSWNSQHHKVWNCFPILIDRNWYNISGKYIPIASTPPTSKMDS